MNATIRFQKIVFLGLLLCGLAGCSKPEPQREKLKIAMVTQPELAQQQLQSYAGDVVAREQTTLAFRVAGQITERLVDVGDRVKVGQVLARLDVKDATLQLNTARAQFAQAQSAVGTAQLELKRFQQLLPDHAVSQSQFDAVNNQYQSAVATLKQAQANVAVAKNQTQYNQLIATKNGVITQRNIEVGQVVAAGQAAYQIAMDGDWDVQIAVPEQMVAHVRPQQQAWISLWSAPEQRYEGMIREIAPAADQSRTFMLKVAFKDQHAPIQLGQSARVFLNSQSQQQLKVPLASLSAVNHKAYLWVVNPDHRLKRIWVTLGPYQRDGAIILSGLKQQQWVVVGGVHLLTEGQKIQPVDRDNRPVQIVADAITSHVAP